MAKIAVALAAGEAGELRSAAIRALAAYDEPTTPEQLLSIYAVSTAANQQDIIQTLTARPAFALALLDAIEQQKIPRQDVSALVIRQLQALDNKARQRTAGESLGRRAPGLGGEEGAHRQTQGAALAGCARSRPTSSRGRAGLCQNLRQLPQAV